MLLGAGFDDCDGAGVGAVLGELVGVDGVVWLGVGLGGVIGPGFCCPSEISALSE